MKVIKPNRLGILTRVMTPDGRRYHLAIAGLVSVPLASPRSMGMEIGLWQEVADHVPGGVLDEANAKPNGEVVVCGSAVAPKGEPATAVMTRLLVKRGHETLIDKKLAVQGDRYWSGSTPTEAQPFTELPLTWERAFGGEGFERNPVGKGAVALETEHGPVQPLPNVEDPKNLVVDLNDRPEPVGYGPIDLTWPQRFQHAGTIYDEDWLKRRFPGPATDFDPRFYQVAPVDQQIEGYFRGDETIRVEGMHPDGPVEGALAPILVKALATQRDPQTGEERFTSITLSLETIVVLPSIGRAILIHRGVLPVAGDDADDVQHLMLAAEDPQHRKSLDHYREVLKKRLDKDKGALLSLKDEDLMPPAVEGWLAKPDYGDMAEKTKLDHRGLAKAEKGRKAKLAEARQKLLDSGFEVPDDYEGPDAPPIPDPYDVDALVKVVEEMEDKQETMLAQAKQDEARMKEEAREAFAEAGMDWDAEAAKALEEAGGPPDFRADDQLVMLHDMARIAAEGGVPMEDLERDLLDPKYEAMLRDLEARVQQSYVQFAHLMPAAKLPDEARRQQLRVIVTASLDGDEPLAGRDLTGAGLSGMDLRGADLSGAFLEGADLSGARLAGANLRGAVLARADLTDTDLSGADLSECNLGATKLVRTDLTEATLKNTVLMKSELDGALLHGTVLEGVDFLEVELTHADFSQSQAKQALFLQMDLRRASFAGASLVEARFLQVDLRGVDFTGATLDRAQFIQCEGDGAIFDGASLVGAQFVHEASFLRGGFAKADLTSANLHKCPLEGADFRGANLSKANLIKADLRGANLHRIVAREALAMRADLRGADVRGADLLGAVLQMADLRGTDLTGCNVSRGDLSLVHTDGTTKIGEALLLDTRVDPRRQEEPA